MTRLGREIIRLGVVASTMVEVAKLAAAGAGEGVVVVADHQTRGRGRLGRDWVSAPGASLLCSVLLRPRVAPHLLGSLTLLIGLVVAEAIETASEISCQLKWPNDVLIDGRKVAGILTQSRLLGGRPEHVIVGIGVNLSGCDGIPESATSLKSQGSPIERDELLSILLDHLEGRYQIFVNAASELSGLVTSAHGTSDWLREWRRRALFIGDNVSIIVADSQIEGRFVDVDDLGRMLLELTSGEVIALSSGEINRGPRPVVASRD